ncbi:rhomboid family intramembrane serine protease [Natrarchaeobaculum sulfurireducens]|uniref:Membrane associated serine protease n=1 Tax=Natrarchaeobaculum sulfurireducens TaxID=2044521 RepID=A0A346PF24_9EURY|nr:rhomboid family intramembrane serine protease [Natrarchaeobaculum sulfurireducens]AXR78119.1 Membrane associated serine protease [Natrarchaeobaculum sulfurireducens]
MRSFTGIALAVLLAVVLLGSVAVLRRLHEPSRGWYEAASSRLVLGVPWGTLVVVAFVTAVYLFVQDGITDPTDPVSIPYRAWSYFSPLGMATASFSHASLSHFTGNMAGTLLVAPIAEFVWGHYPDERDGTGDGLWHTPWVRAVVIFPLVVIGIGFLTSLFALGPVIGFSGLVYAFAGFAIVRYPIATLLATTLLQSAALTTVRALQTPVYVYVAEASPPQAPSWATIAIQGHALGFFIGLVLGIVLLERRGIRPNPLRVWLAVVLFAFAKGLWQIYWFGEGNSFLLFQGPGIAVVTVLAVVITLAVAASDEPALPSSLDRFRASSPAEDLRIDLRRPIELAREVPETVEDSSARLERIADLVGGERSADVPSLSFRTQRGTAFVAVLLVLAVVAGIAVPTNLLVMAEPSHDEETTLTVDDYTIEYTKEAENLLVSGFGLDELTEDEGLEASGVIVSSGERTIWLEAVSADHLEFVGEETVSVGGPGWRETVTAERSGWELVGNDTVYQVWLSADGDERLAYESDSASANVRIQDRTVAIAPQDGEFVLGVEFDGDLETAPVPEDDEFVEIGGLTVENDDGTLYAASNGTEVAVASEETYN